jgi:ActR/RegA family two-component response regulator
MKGGERRKHPRASLVASVVLWRNEQRLGSFPVVNLSAGGVLLSGEAPVADGTEVLAVLRLGGDSSLRATAKVARAIGSRAGASFALSFAHLAPEAEEAIGAAVKAALALTLDAAVLIVDDSTEVCSALGRQLNRMGLRSCAATTPLEAVGLLEQPNQIEIALIDLRLGSATGLDLLAYLAEQHPAIRRVLMSGQAQPAQLQLARHASLKYSAHQVLAKPWNDDTLARALGR